MDIARGRRNVADADRAAVGYDRPRSARTSESEFALARALDRFAAEPIRLKWPNDLYVDDRKLGRNSHRSAVARAEARMGRDRNRHKRRARPTDVPLAASLDSGTRRVDVLTDVDPCHSGSAAQLCGESYADRAAEWDARDMARGTALLRACARNRRRNEPGG